MKTRLDRLLVERGLAESREKAQALIMAGEVLVNRQKASKPGQNVDADANIEVMARPPYVSRGGFKLAGALDRFGIDPAGKVCVDIGASTGGFTDVLLRSGAAHVVALDVGHGQLDWRIRNDPRVTVFERVNARALTPETFGSAPRLFEIITIDVSFISLRLILPSVAPLLTGASDVVALVKPQFEAGRDEVGKGGLITDPSVHARVINEVMQAATVGGLDTIAQTPSPIAGQEGNREFLLHLRRTGAGASSPTPHAATAPEPGPTS